VSRIWTHNVDRKSNALPVAPPALDYVTFIDRNHSISTGFGLKQDTSNAPMFPTYMAINLIQGICSSQHNHTHLLGRTPSTLLVKLPLTKSRYRFIGNYSGKVHHDLVWHHSITVNAQRVLKTSHTVNLVHRYSMATLQTRSTVINVPCQLKSCQLRQNCMIKSHLRSFVVVSV